jgi:uncharacterized phiE125 gp8 family phage protein
VSLAVIDVDRDALPAALLPLAKQHMRIDGSFEDAFITSVLARAIARFQQLNDVTVNPSTFTWTPPAAAFNGQGGATLPVRPVSAFTATVPGDPDPVDVAADYALALKWDSPYGVPVQLLTGAAADGLTVGLTAGYADLAGLPPEVQDVVLRHAAHLYEHREILLPGSEYVAPDLKLDATWWMPRV